MPTVPPHPLVASLNSLLASLLIPLSVPTLQLATPSLLLSVLEAILGTRIQDVHDDWRGSWDRQHRRAVTDVLVHAIDEVQQVLASRLPREEDDASARPAWRADEVDIHEVVRGREDAVARLVEALLDIARALGVLPEPSGPEKSPPTTPKARERFLPQGATLPSPPETPRARSRFPSLAPSKLLENGLSRSSPPPASRDGPPVTQTALFAPRPLRAPRPPAPPHTPPPPTPTPRAHPPPPLSPTAPSFLAQVAADRWRSPPPPVCPLSPRRRRVSGSERGARGRAGEVAEQEGEREEAGASERRRSTLEVLRRKMAAAQAAMVAAAAAGARAAEETGDGPAQDDEATCRGPADSAGEGECAECSAPAQREEAETRRRSRTGRRSSLTKAASRQSLAESRSTSSGSSASSSTSSLDVTFALSPTRSNRQPRRHPRQLAPCTCAHPPPLHLPPPPYVLASRARVSTPESALGSVDSKPRRVRLSRPRPPGSLGRRHPSSAPSAPTDDTPSAAELSLHSSTDIDSFEQSSASLHPRPRPRARAPPPPAAAASPPSSSEPAQSATSPPSPYTLLLLAHRERLREKLALLERRERDRREAAAAAEGVASEGRAEAEAEVPS